MKRIIGVTGGVGAGKSRILSILKEEYGAHVILADQTAKELMEPGKECFKRVVGLLGPGILTPEGAIDRPAMARRIFGDPDLLEQVNRLTHPAVWRAVMEEAASCKEELVVIEAAVPGEEFRDNCREMWYVYTSEENRIERLLKNRGYDREKSLSIIKSQASEEQFRAFCSQVIDNNGTVAAAREQIRHLLSGTTEETAT